MTGQHSLIGRHIDEADTPALWIDLDAFEHNASKMLRLCNNQNVRWRPHVKASKSPDLAHRLISIGAQGITCAKVAEAEAMAAGGINAAFGNVDPEDSWKQHFADTYIEGYGIGDPYQIEIMTKEKQ